MGLRNTLRGRHHNSNCENVNSKFKTPSFLQEIFYNRTGVVNPVQTDVEHTEMMPSTSDEPSWLQEEIS